MQSLNIKPEKKSPAVLFEPYSGLLLMKGRSSLENPEKFFQPVINWLTEYAGNPSVKTTFRMEMEYFNSSTAKHLMKLLRILEAMYVSGSSEVIVQWCYDESDGSMYEAGADYDSMLKMKFEMMSS